MSTVIVSQPARSALPVTRWATRTVTHWHLLSLDAPSVAVAWLFLLTPYRLSAALSIAVPALAIAVWIIYVADRLLDSYRRNGKLHERHRFHWRHRRLFLAGLLASAAVLALLLPFLPKDLLRTWLLLALPLGIYAAFVHLRWVRVPKEFIVGTFFAFVVGVPSLHGMGGASHTSEIMTFGLLCCCNCLAITLWEGEAGAIRNSAHSVFRRMLVLLAGSCLICLLSPQTLAVGVAAFLSGVLLLALHRHRRRMGPLMLRSLADAALLTPLLVIPFLHHR